MGKSNLYRYQGVIVDWLAATALVIFSRVLNANILPYERNPALYVNDSNVHKEFLGTERVPSDVNVVLSLWIPSMIAALFGLVRRSWFEAQSALLTTYAAQAMMRVTVDIIKLMVGRLRPDFFGRCQWDVAQQICTGASAIVTEGRKSFPSGHSATTFTGTIILVLFLAGKTKAFVPSILPDKLGGPFWWRTSRLPRLTITISPLLLSFYVALSRIQDHVHHPEDVLIGSLIGVTIGTIAYLLYWPSPFNPNALKHMSKPRSLPAELMLLPVSHVEEERLLSRDENDE